MKPTNSKKRVSIGVLVNKLEKNIALANMRGDRSAAKKFGKMLEAALNGTQMPKVIA